MATVSDWWSVGHRFDCRPFLTTVDSLFPCVSLSLSAVIWYRQNGGDAVQCEGNCRPSIGRLLSSSWHRFPVGWLPRNCDTTRHVMSSTTQHIETGATFAYPEYSDCTVLHCTCFFFALPCSGSAVVWASERASSLQTTNCSNLQRSVWETFTHSSHEQ